MTVTASVRVATSDVAASVTLTWMTARAAVLPSSTSVALKTRLFTQAVAWAAVPVKLSVPAGAPALPTVSPPTTRSGAPLASPSTCTTTVTLPTPPFVMFHPLNVAWSAPGAFSVLFSDTDSLVAAEVTVGAASKPW